MSCDSNTAPAASVAYVCRKSRVMLDEQKTSVLDIVWGETKLRKQSAGVDGPVLLVIQFGAQVML